MEQNENTLSVLKIAPGQYPQQVEIDNDLKALQQAVGGSIGASYPFEDPFFDLPCCQIVSNCPSCCADALNVPVCLPGFDFKNFFRFEQYCAVKGNSCARRDNY